MAKKVTVINAVPKSGQAQTQQKLRVCAYARVSTDSRSQEQSYAAQVEYYTAKIQSNPLWEFAGVYADQGTTGTKMQGREEFNAMVSACEDGGIDLILTKSLTRFARNTVDCIQTIRKLKAIGVGIYFEKENINTLTEASELMLTILASVAQGESEDISGNNRWAVIKRFENGTFITSTPAYGYRNDKDGNLIIEEKEAEIVRRIFGEYLNGTGAYMIARHLDGQKIPTIRGSEKWNEETVRWILKNPVYEGNVINQKTYTEKSFPFVRKHNHGQVNMYLEEDAHPPIVTHEEAEAVRNILEYRNRNLKGKNDATNRYAFSGKIVCGVCGKHFRRQRIHIGKPSETIIWMCRQHMLNKDVCQMKSVREDVVKQAFTNMWNKLYTNQGTVLEPLLKGLIEIAESRPDTQEKEKLENEIQNLNEQYQILNRVMKQGYIDTAVFMEKSNQITQRMAECRKKKIMLERKQKRTKEIISTEQLIGILKGEGYQKEFNEELFHLTVKEIKISSDYRISFCLKNGLTLIE